MGQELLSSLGVPAEKFASTCVLVDKLDKLPPEDVRSSLVEAGLDEAATETLLTTLEITDFTQLEEVMGSESPAVLELKRLFSMAEAYGIADWLVLDLSVVRGLAYYTGVVFEGFDRSGELRAIFGGGRYNKLLSTFGGEDLAAAGFGFGDAVIVELLKMKGLLPHISGASAEIVIFPFNEDLRAIAMGLASKLPGQGRAWTWCSNPRRPSGCSSTLTGSRRST